MAKRKDNQERFFNAGKLRAEKARVQWTNEELAERAKCSNTYVSHAINGKLANLEILEKIAQALGLRVQIVFVQDESGS